MNLPITAISLPLTINGEGVVLFRGTRVPLDSVVIEFKQGATPEEIAEQFSSLTLADIYAVISYYLHHKQEVETYLSQRQKRADELRLLNEYRFPSQGLRERLIARRANVGQSLKN